MQTRKYQRSMVRASDCRLRTSSMPVSRAVLKPKVREPSGSGRSLKMVLGTWHTDNLYLALVAAACTKKAECAVAVPPIVCRNKNARLSETVRNSVLAKPNARHKGTYHEVADAVQLQHAEAVVHLLGVVHLLLARAQNGAALILDPATDISSQQNRARHKHRRTC